MSSSIQQQEQTLNCENCKIDIIRDSEEHNNCIIDDTGEKIYCINCVEYCEEDIDKQFQETNCLCGNNKHKGWLNKVGGDMICEDCDIGGVNQMITEEEIPVLHSDSDSEEEEIRNIDTVD